MSIYMCVHMYIKIYTCTCIYNILSPFRFIHMHLCPVLTTWYWTDSLTLSGHWLCVAPHLEVVLHGIPLSTPACQRVLSSC